MDFFKRHLNWTLALSWVVCWLLLLVASNIAAPTNLVYVIYYSFGFLLLVITTWYLRQKNRSEWWTLCWLPWFLAAILALKGTTPPIWAGILQGAPFLLVLLKDRTWRPLTD